MSNTILHQWEISTLLSNIQALARSFDPGKASPEEVQELLLLINNNATLAYHQLALMSPVEFAKYDELDSNDE